MLELLGTVAELNNLLPKESNLRWPAGYQRDKNFGKIYHIHLLSCINSYV